MSTTPTGPQDQQPVTLQVEAPSAAASVTANSFSQHAGEAPSPPQQAMSAPSLLGRRRLTAPPHLMGFAAEASFNHGQQNLGDSASFSGTPPSASMPSAASSAGTLPWTGAGSASFGSQQSLWADQLYAAPSASFTPPSYGYHPHMPPQLYSFRPQDTNQAHSALAVQPKSAVSAGDSPENSANGSPEFAQTFYDPFQVKHRRRTTAPQLKVLEAQFATNPKPDIPVRKALAEELGMTPREVQVWFQNRRAKSKRLEKKAQAAAEGNGGGAGPNASSTDAFASAPVAPEPPRMSERQRSEQQYFNVLAKAEQQATTSANAQLPQSSQLGQPSYYKQGDPASASIPSQSQLLNRRMTMPADTSAMGYQGLQVPLASYPPAMWQHQSVSQQPSPHNFLPAGEEQLASGAQPSLSRLHIPSNDQGLAASSASYVPGVYGSYRSPMADPFSPASQADGVSPGAPDGSSYFPQPSHDLPSSAFPHPDDLYFTQQRRQHSSGSISSTGESSLSYDPSTGAMTPTSSLSFSTAATTPVEYLPPGFDPNSRRASCPAEFIASFDGMSMPQQYPGTTAQMTSLNTTSQPFSMQPQYAHLPHDMSSGLSPISPRRHSIAVGTEAVGGLPDEYSYLPPSTGGGGGPGTNASRSPGFPGQRTLTPGHLDPIAEAPHVHQPRALSPTQPPHFLNESAESESPKEELQSDKDLTSPVEPPTSPASKKGGQPNTARKSRSSSSVRSVYRTKSSDKLT